MYTGTLIDDLMATVERAERRALRKSSDEEVGMLQMFEIDAAQMDSEPLLAGAA